MNTNHVNAMPEKTPLDYPMFQYFLVVLLSSIGGFVSILQEFVDQIGKCWKCAIARAIVNMVTSGFCGVLAFWLCESIDIKPLVTACVIGIAGNMGGRTLKVIEKIIVKKFNGVLYEAIQAHVTQSDWTPPAVPALWKVVEEQGGGGTTWIDTGVTIAQLVGAGVYRVSGVPTITLNQAIRLGDLTAGETVFTCYWPTTGTPSDYIKISPHVTAANGAKVWKWA